MRRTVLSAFCAVLLAVTLDLSATDGVSFGIIVDGAAPVALTRCGEIGTDSEVIEFRSGGDPDPYAQKIPGRIEIPNVTCSRPLSPDRTFSNWRAQVEAGDFPAARKNVSIVLYDKGREVSRYNFTNAWPKKYSVALDDDTGIVMETVVFAVERITRP